MNKVEIEKEMNEEGMTQVGPQEQIGDEKVVAQATTDEQNGDEKVAAQATTYEQNRDGRVAAQATTQEQKGEEGKRQRIKRLEGYRSTAEGRVRELERVYLEKEQNRMRLEIQLAESISRMEEWKLRNARISESLQHLDPSRTPPVGRVQDQLNTLRSQVEEDQNEIAQDKEWFQETVKAHNHKTRDKNKEIQENLERIKAITDAKVQRRAKRLVQSYVHNDKKGGGQVDVHDAYTHIPIPDRQAKPAPEIINAKPNPYNPISYQNQVRTQRDKDTHENKPTYEGRFNLENRVKLESKVQYLQSRRPKFPGIQRRLGGYGHDTKRLRPNKKTVVVFY